MQRVLRAAYDRKLEQESSREKSYRAVHTGNTGVSQEISSTAGSLRRHDSADVAEAIGESQSDDSLSNMDLYPSISSKKSALTPHDEGKDKLYPFGEPMICENLFQTDSLSVHEHLSPNPSPNPSPRPKFKESVSIHRMCHSASLSWKNITIYSDSNHSDPVLCGVSGYVEPGNVLCILSPVESFQYVICYSFLNMIA